MTKPTARVLALLEILQSGGTWTVGELAQRLEVDERTVRRYATHLTDLDVPIRSLRGRYGGYRLAPGFRLPPLMFTDDEAVAVLFGLVTARRTAPATVPAASSDSAMAKLRRVLPEPSGRRLDALLAAANFTTSTAASASHTGIDSAAAQSLLLLAEAAGARQPVALDYTDRHARHSNRMVHPYGLVVHSGRWYVVAADPTDGQVRNFRLDRITAPTLRQGTFDVPAGFDAGSHVVDNLADAPRRHTVSVRVHASADQVRARIPSGLASSSRPTSRGGSASAYRPSGSTGSRPCWPDSTTPLSSKNPPLSATRSGPWPGDSSGTRNRSPAARETPTPNSRTHTDRR